MNGTQGTAPVCWQSPLLRDRSRRQRATQGRLHYLIEVRLACLDAVHLSIMEMPVKFSRFSKMTSIAVLLAAPTLVFACCPGGGQGVQLATAGLGESQPAALDLSSDPAWLVYAFERDGVSYYQVNDLTGQVNLIIAAIDSTFWTLPAGKTAARVSLPSAPLALPKNARRSVVFRGPDFSLVVYGEGRSAVWAVEHIVSGR